MNLYITFIFYFTSCPFVIAILYPIPPLYFGDLYPYHYHQKLHNHHHHHHQLQQSHHHNSASSIYVENTKNHNIGHVNVHQSSKSKESKFFIEWAYKFAASIKIGGGRYQSSSSIGIGIGVVNGKDKQKPSGNNEKPNHSWIDDHNSYVTQESVERPVTHNTITTAKPTKPSLATTTTTTTTSTTPSTTTSTTPTTTTSTTPTTTTSTTTTSNPDEDEDCETISPIPEINVESTTKAPNPSVISTTTEESLATPKTTISPPASSENKDQSGQSSKESETNAHTGSCDIPGVSQLIESIASGIKTQTQALPCSQEQLIVIKTGPVNVEKNTDPATGSTSIVVKPIIVVAPISVASACVPNC